MKKKKLVYKQKLNDKKNKREKHKKMRISKAKNIRGTQKKVELSHFFTYRSIMHFITVSILTPCGMRTAVMDGKRCSGFSTNSSKPMFCNPSRNR